MINEYIKHIFKAHDAQLSKSLLKRLEENISNTICSAVNEKRLNICMPEKGYLQRKWSQDVEKEMGDEIDNETIIARIVTDLVLICIYEIKCEIRQTMGKR